MIDYDLLEKLKSAFNKRGFSMPNFSQEFEYWNDRTW